jgi:lysophospholipase L1-like esterase
MHRTIPFAVMTAMALALAACGGEPEQEGTSAAPRPTAASPSGTASPSPSAPSEGRVYVALGDSLAAGYQPGGTELRETAYPALTAGRLAGEGPELEVENLGCSGETTTSLIEGGKCDFDEASQLAQAESVLRQRGNDVALVTIDIGGNDLLRCVRGGAEVDTSCVADGVQTVEKNLPTILGRLRSAAGDDVPVLVLGYYNPWLAAKALDQPVKGLDDAARAYTSLSRAIQDAAKATQTTFVGLDEAFATKDTTPTEINGRTVPENAARICTLTNICTVGDIHLTDEGAATVARVLAEAAADAGVRASS